LRDNHIDFFEDKMIKQNNNVKLSGSHIIQIVLAVIAAIAVIIAAIISYYATLKGASLPIEASQTAEAKTQTAQAKLVPPIPIPTVFYFGDLVFDFDFSIQGAGNCNNFDSRLLGYDTTIPKKYYIIPPSKTGYISVCHYNNDLPPQGILQTTAFPESDQDYFGYAVLFGWKGGVKSTTDACGFGVKKDGSNTKAIFIQEISGNWEEFPTDLKGISLSIKPHAIRTLLYPSGDANGYLDGIEVAKHLFKDCSKGPVGLLAYGPGGVKINFTNLKLYNLPLP
jgi:hypothetical protein